MPVEAMMQPVDVAGMTAPRPLSDNLEISASSSVESIFAVGSRQSIEKGNGAEGRTLARQADSTAFGRIRVLKDSWVRKEHHPPISTFSRGQAIYRGCGRRIIEMVGEEQAFGHVFLAVPVFLGLGAVIWFSLPVEPAPLVLWAFFVPSVVVAWFLQEHHGWGRYLPAVAALALAGMLLAAFEDWRRSTIVLDQPVTTIITGIVEKREPSGAGRWRYVLALESTVSPKLRRQPNRITVISRSPGGVFDIGDRITGRARISPPSGPALPGLVDFAFSSYFDGVGAIGFFYGAPVRVGGAVTVTWTQTMERTFFSWRSAIAQRIRETVPGDAGAFAAAIVTDERRAISPETTEALRISGLAHIVAISGLNMALAAGIFFVGMRGLLALLPGFAQAFPVKKLAAFAALLMATGYYLISGFGVSAERAYIMMAIMLAAVFFDRPSISLRNVALSALVVLVISPSEILGPSFQMSFAATVALVAGYSAWSQRKSAHEERPLRINALKPIFEVGRLAGGIFATSLIGGLSTAAFSIEHFHRMSTYGLIANLCAMPLVSFIVMPFGLIGMLLMPFGLDGPFLRVMCMGLEAVITVANTVAGWGGNVDIGRQPAWFLPAATIGFLLLTLLRTRLNMLSVPVLALTVLLAWRAGYDPPPDFIVSEDGNLVALLTEDQVATNRARPPDFFYGQWRHALLLPQATGPAWLDLPVAAAKVGTSPAAVKPKQAMGQNAAEPAGVATSAKASTRRPPLSRDELLQAQLAMQRAIGDHPPDRFACTAGAWCITRTTQGPTIAVVEDARFTGSACDIVQVVIAPRARFDHCRSGALLINGEALRRTGALELRFNGTDNPQKWNVAAAMRGTERSWMRHRQYDWRRNVFSPSSPDSLIFPSGQSSLSDSGE